MGILNWSHKVLGIDAGSQRLRIVHGDEIVFNERSCVFVNTVSGKMVGVGNFSSPMVEDISLSPIDYTISDFAAFEHMLRKAIGEIFNNISFFNSYTLYFCIPTSLTEIDKRAFTDSGEHAGAKEVVFIYQSYCTALGLSILEEKGSFVLIDFSASKIEVTVFDDGIIRAEKTLRLGTNRLFELIQDEMKHKFQLVVSYNEVSDLLLNYKKHERNDSFKIGSTEIPFEFIRNILQSYGLFINNQLQSAMDYVKSPKAIKAKAILSNGFYLTGGAVQYDCLVDLLEYDKTIPRTISKTPLLDNCNGLKKVMRDPKKYNYLLLKR